MDEVTRILSEIEKGSLLATDELFPLVYDELRALAARKMARDRPGQTLQPTALVHEAYMRLVDAEKAEQWNSRGHFFAAAARAMRRILIEHARGRARQKRGGGRQRVELAAAELALESAPDELLALDEALRRLAASDPAAAKLVDLRYFAGLSMPQAADVLRIPLRTVERNWAYARTWLHRELCRGTDGPND